MSAAGEAGAASAAPATLAPLADPPGLVWGVMEIAGLRNLLTGWRGANKLTAEDRAAIVNQQGGRLDAARRRLERMGFAAAVEMRDGAAIRLIYIGCATAPASAQEVEEFEGLFCEAGGDTLESGNRWYPGCGSVLAAIRDAGAREGMRLTWPDNDIQEAKRDWADNPRELAAVRGRSFACFPVPPRLRSLADGTLADLAAAVPLGYSVADAISTLGAFGGNPDLAAIVLAGRVPAMAKGASCTIEGLLLAGALSLLGGAAGQGKTSLMLDMAHAIASGSTHFLDLPIHPDVQGKPTVFLYAEDRPRDLDAKLLRMTVARGPGRVLCIRASDYDLGSALVLLRDMPEVGGIFIDPALPWAASVGLMDENDNPKVGAFLDRLVALAAERGCPVLLSHHLGAIKREREEPKTPQDVLRAIRGAQAFRDRPRCILTLHHVGGETVFGVAKSNVQEEVPERAWRLTFDPATGLSTNVGDWTPPQPGRKGRRAAPVVLAPARTDMAPAADALAEDARAVAALVARIVASGEKVTRTGKGGPFIRHKRCAADVPEVAGWPRARVEAAVDHAVAGGLLTNDDNAGLRPA